MAEKAGCDNIVYKRKSRRAEKGDLQIAKDDLSDLFSKKDRINFRRIENAEQIQQDLEALNMIYEEHNSNPQSFAKEVGRLRTKFFIAQYRGITYLTTFWSQIERRLHRKFDEVNLPVFSMATYRRANLIPSSLADLTQQADHITTLTKTAEGIKRTIMAIRQKKEFAFKKRNYDSLADLLQELYTVDYARFHKVLAENYTLRNLFPESANPFISTGDRPYHALKYAYGIKPYEGREHERLRPRWQKNGRAERPYSGKLFASLHPITDYASDGPTHVPTLNAQGKIVVNNMIVAEYESTFPGFIPADRVFHTHTAKYPSFKGEYKRIYGYKYGLTKTLYQKFKQAFIDHLPHTLGNKSVKRLLGEWLCAYAEAKLIDKAMIEAHDRGGVLIYRSINGFALELGEATPFHSSASKEDFAIAKQKRASRASKDSSPAISHSSGEGRRTELSKSALFVSTAKTCSMEDVDEEFWDIDVNDDGRCMFYVAVLGCLLPRLSDENAFKEKCKEIFDEFDDSNGIDLYHEMKSFDASKAWCTKYLKQLVDYKLRPKMTKIFLDLSLDDQAAIMKEIGKNDIESAKEYLLNIGTWGGNAEVSLLAQLTGFVLELQGTYYYPDFSKRAVDEVSVEDRTNAIHILYEDNHYRLRVVKSLLTAEMNQRFQEAEEVLLDIDVRRNLGKEFLNVGEDDSKGDSDVAPKSITLEGMDAWDIDVKGDGNCLYYSMIMSYLLPHVNAEAEFSSRFLRIFGDGDSENLRTTMLNYNGANEWCATYLKDLVNGDGGLRSRLSERLESNGEEVFIDRVLVHYEYTGENKKDKFCSLIRSANTFGNAGEATLFANLTGINVHLQRYNVWDVIHLDGNITSFGENDAGEESIRISFVYLQDGEGNKVGHYHYLILKEQLTKEMNDLFTEMSSNVLAEEFEVTDDYKDVADSKHDENDSAYDRQTGHWQSRAAGSASKAGAGLGIG